MGWGVHWQALQGQLGSEGQCNLWPSPTSLSGLSALICKCDLPIYLSDTSQLQYSLFIACKFCVCVCVYIYDNRVIKFILCPSLWVICCFFKLISYLAFPQISSKDFISVSEIQINTFIKGGTLILESGNSEVMFFSTWLVLITSLLTVICVFKKCIIAKDGRDGLHFAWSVILLLAS